MKQSQPKIRHWGPCLCPLFLSAISLSNLIPWQRFLALLSVDSQSYHLKLWEGKMSRRPPASLFNHWFHPRALCWVWLVCLNVSGYQGTQTCRTAGLVGRIRSEGEAEAILLLVWQELCWNKHLSPPPTPNRQQWPQRLDREKEIKVWRRKKLDESFLCYISLPPLPPTPPFPLSLPHIRTT